jgi:hypothetical protein
MTPPPMFVGSSPASKLPIHSGAIVANPVVAGVAIVAKVGAPVVKAVTRTAFGLAARIPGLRGLLPSRAKIIGQAIPKREIIANLGTAVVAGTTLSEVGGMLPGSAGATARHVGGQLITAAKTAARAADIVLPGKGIPFIETGISTRRETPMGHPDAGTAITLRPTTQGLMPASESIVKTWHANGIPFWQTIDGWIYVQRLDGTVRRYKPHKSVVLGKRPSTRQINRAINKLKSEYKVHKKLHAIFGPKRRS